MNRILILFGHPTFRRSRVNQTLRHAVDTLEGVTFHDLYDTYPDFFIDVHREQFLCESHEVIVFQHPLYWYSTPAIFKEWLDLVLEHGWAYGHKGKALHGKIFFQALTAGGDAGAYRREGANRFTISDLTAPVKAMANLCGMRWLPPFAVFGAHRGIAEQDLARQASIYRETILALRDGRLDLDKACTRDHLNDNLADLVQGGTADGTVSP